MTLHQRGYALALGASLEDLESFAALPGAATRPVLGPPLDRGASG